MINGRSHITVMVLDLVRDSITSRLRQAEGGPMWREEEGGGKERGGEREEGGEEKEEGEREEKGGKREEGEGGGGENREE